jgi:hypothetical protein
MTGGGEERRKFKRKHRTRDKRQRNEVEVKEK